MCMVSPGAKCYIPELEFEIGADSKRHIDSLYNHIATATFNLATYCRTNSAMPDSDRVCVSTKNVKRLPDRLMCKTKHQLVHLPS